MLSLSSSIDKIWVNTAVTDELMAENGLGLTSDEAKLFLERRKVITYADLGHLKQAFPGFAQKFDKHKKILLF